jgi:hypothetical protein
MAEEVKPKAPAAPAAKPQAAKSNVPVVVAVHRINGDIEPGTPVLPASNAQLQELLDLGAVREATESEAALFEKTIDSIKKLIAPLEAAFD